LAFMVTVGAADAAAGRAAAARQPSKARQVDALRISFSPLLMDRSASIRVAPEPCRSGDIEIPGNSAGEQWRRLQTTLSIAADRCKLQAAVNPAFAGDHADGPFPIARKLLSPDRTTPL